MEVTDIQYKESEIGVIPVDWEVKPLEELCRKKGLVRGPFGGALKKEFFVRDGIKVYEQQNAINRDFSLGDYFIDLKKFEELSRFEVKPNDFIVSCSGTIGRIFMIPINAPKGIINQALLKITIDESIVKKQFFLHYFEWDEFQLKIIDSTQGGAMKNLVGMAIFRDTKFAVPPKSEQTAIATALSDTDALIENLEKLIAKKRNIKQGVMQELLTGRKRLAGFIGKWVTIKIGEVADIHKGNGLSKTKLKQAGKYGCILYGELFTTYKRIIKNAISHTDYEEGVYSKAGDILMPGSTTTTGIDLAIASAVLKGNILLGGDINVIRPKTASINSIFLAYYITEVLKHKILELTQGITIIHLYGKDLKTLEIAIPEISEQDAIGKILVDIDEELSGLEKQMNKYQLIKQGMMQKLLTGKIRLV